MDIEEEASHRPARNGPARQRRRERREAARAGATAAAEEAVCGETSEKYVSVIKEYLAKPVATSEEDVVTKEIPKATIVEPCDEIEKVSMEEKCRVDEICSNVSIIPIRNVNPNDEVVQTSIRSKLEAKKVKVIDIRIFRSSQGTFTRGDVKIEPAAGKRLENTDFEFANCRVIPYYGVRIL